MTGAEFKTIRLKTGLSQAALSLRLGVSHGRISNWELNYRPIPEEYANIMDPKSTIYISATEEEAKKIGDKIIWPTEQEVGEVLK